MKMASFTWLPLHCSGILVLLSLSTSPISAQEQDFTELSIEELSTVSVAGNPASVLSSHIHKAGEWMLTYRYQHMDMKGNRDGTDSISTAQVLSDFPVTPLEMSMDMHMFSLMYAPTDAVTLMAMLPYKEFTMDHATRTGVRFTTEAEGIGDLQTMANVVLLRTPGDVNRLNLTLGISFPTASINQKDATPMGPAQQLPYPMQLGSGTYDLVAGLGYSKIFDRMSWGGQAQYTARLGRNKLEYSLGDNFKVQTWLSYGWTQWFSTSLRLDGQTWQNIDGADLTLNPAIVPTADTQLRAGKRIDMRLELELYFPRGRLRGHRLSVHGGLPVYQSLDGPQLEMDAMLGANWQWQF